MEPQGGVVPGAHGLSAEVSGRARDYPQGPKYWDLASVLRDFFTEMEITVGENVMEQLAIYWSINNSPMGRVRRRTVVLEYVYQRFQDYVNTWRAGELRVVLSNAIVKEGWQGKFGHYLPPDGSSSISLKAVIVERGGNAGVHSDPQTPMFTTMNQRCLVYKERSPRAKDTPEDFSAESVIWNHRLSQEEAVKVALNDRVEPRWKKVIGSGQIVRVRYTDGRVPEWANLALSTGEGVLASAHLCRPKVEHV